VVAAATLPGEAAVAVLRLRPRGEAAAAAERRRQLLHRCSLHIAAWPRP
jgi:hypothetical protein